MEFKVMTHSIPNFYLDFVAIRGFWSSFNTKLDQNTAAVVDNAIESRRSVKEI